MPRSVTSCTGSAWGAPRICSELQKLGFVVSEATVSRYIRRVREYHPDPDVLGRWMAFLRNHKDGIAAMDFFTVPTATMNVLYGHHARRRILHFNATYHPNAQWVIQQLRETFLLASAPRHLIFDRDSIFSRAVVGFVKAMGSRAGPRIAARGRIRSRSAGSGASATRCSTTS